MFANKRPPLFITFPAALVFYAVLAVLLFYPYHQSLVSYKRLFPLEAIIASAGVFILCRRWVLSFFASTASAHTLAHSYAFILWPA
jgi:branched-subunit amino acid transport protein AzlD